MSSKIQICIIILICSNVFAHVQEDTKDIFQAEIDEYHQEIAKNLEEEADSTTKKLNEELDQLNQSKAYVCTNGIMPQQLSPSQYLTQFAKGPCNPAVVLPGIMGSKLVATIDCEALKKEILIPSVIAGGLDVGS